LSTYRSLIIVEHDGHNLSAYVPDLPGCAATCATRDEPPANMRDAIAPHFRGMIENVEVSPPHAIS
jgi:predicted RNase H-like HicB family nuclease